jgi:hypothetical protein
MKIVKIGNGAHAESGSSWRQQSRRGKSLSKVTPQLAHDTSLEESRCRCWLQRNCARALSFPRAAGVSRELRAAANHHGLGRPTRVRRLASLEIGS